MVITQRLMSYTRWLRKGKEKPQRILFHEELFALFLAAVILKEQESKKKYFV